MEENTRSFVELLPFLTPLILLELGLLIFALVDLIRRRKVRGDNKVLWALLIIFVQIIGPCLYLLLGRKEEPVDSDQD
jgi:hypothetical protein